MLSPFPMCELHGHRLVRKFPPGCPLAHEHDKDVHYSLVALKDESFSDARGDPADAVLAGKIYDCCSACVFELLSNSHVQRLRGRSATVHA